MIIKSIRLKNYRNYRDMRISFSERKNIILGDNGQGKTNILEAIFICASARSHRTSRDIDIVMMGEKDFFIKLEMEKHSVESSIEFSYSTEQKKRIRINEIPLKKIGEMIGQLNVVMFSPEDLMVIKEGPSERRKFIDITLSQLRPAYFYDLQQYNKILVHRNNLLKDTQYNKSLIDTLDVWNDNLVKTGARIIKTRNEYLLKLSEYSRKIHSKLTNNLEVLDMKYSSSIKSKNFNDIKLIEDDFYKMLESVRKKELLKLTTLCGPQRDDYEIFLNGNNIKLYGSQGQQRTAILSIKLAEIDIIKDYTGESPVLLLDDVMSELDENRRKYLVENLEGVQTFITSTGESHSKWIIGEKDSCYNVFSGNITKVR